LHGTLTTYEMNIKKYNMVTKKETFKASKKTKQKNTKNEKPNSRSSDVSEDDEEVANFIIRMKKRTIKYKGKIPLICLIFYGIGHFANKWPHKKNK